VTAALLEAPSASQAPPAVRRLRTQTGLTSTHLLAGAGGDTLGLFEAGYTPFYAANHEPICVSSHKSNWAALGTEHHIADIANLAMGDLPGSDVLWASPIFPVRSACLKTMGSYGAASEPADGCRVAARHGGMGQRLAAVYSSWLPWGRR
jgi:hypothetical protein